MHHGFSFDIIIILILLIRSLPPLLCTRLHLLFKYLLRNAFSVSARTCTCSYWVSLTTSCYYFFALETVRVSSSASVLFLSYFVINTVTNWSTNNHRSLWIFVRSFLSIYSKAVAKACGAAKVFVVQMHDMLNLACISKNTLQTMCRLSFFEFHGTRYNVKTHLLSHIYLYLSLMLSISNRGVHWWTWWRFLFNAYV